MEERVLRYCVARTAAITLPGNLDISTCRCSVGKVIAVHLKAGLVCIIRSTSWHTVGAAIIQAAIDSHGGTREKGNGQSRQETLASNHHCLFVVLVLQEREWKMKCERVAVGSVRMTFWGIKMQGLVVNLSGKGLECLFPMLALVGRGLELMGMGHE